MSRAVDTTASVRAGARRAKGGPRGIGFQLGLAFAAVAAFTALLATTVVAVTWQRTFDSYVRGSVQDDASLLAQTASRWYEDAGTWRDDHLVSLAVYGATHNLRVQVRDTSGDILIDSATIDLEQYIGGFTMMPGMSTIMQQSDATPMRDPIVQVPVYVNQRNVGSIRVASVAPGTFMTDRDRAFRSASSVGLLLGAAVAVVLATVGGITYSRLVSRPIERVTRTAAALRGGSRDARTGMDGEDPVGVLGRTLDEMADSIEAEREFERRLTADVAHELRTPLQAIQATVEAMQDGVLPADPEHLGVVRDETVRLARLADSILELSRLENRSTPMRTAPIDPAIPLSRAVETHRALLESLELALVTDIEEGATVIGDTDRLTQAFGNLISNAARYTPPGGTVTVTLRPGPSQVSVAVSDTGIGVAPDERERVFTRFWRSNAARERSRTGFGIGLAVVREIVERSGGTVALASNEPGAGTTATITLPLAAQKGVRQA